MVYVLLANGFEEIEALAPVDFLSRAGIDVRLVSLDPGPVSGAHGIKVKAQCVLSETNLSDGEMIVLPGGLPGTTNLDKHPLMSEILSSVYNRGGYLAAICAAPMVLGKRGYLKGKNAVCYPGFEQYLEGAHLSDSPVVCDGRIVTAKAAGVAWQFGYELAKVFVGVDVCESVRKGLFLPKFGD